MAELLNVIFALAAIFFAFRWLTSGPDDPARAALGFKPRKVTDEMAHRVADIYPDIPRDNIRYDLLRTGDVAVTSEKILTKGYLDAPPSAYYELYPRGPESSSAPHAQPSSTDKGKSPAPPKAESLISRYHLEDRLASASTVVQSPTDVAGKATWEDTPEKREASLRERKAQMILAARQ
ncbi:hypothetical protein PUNSTDRAFT_74748 [Punctularia strigosozonata HHB-11173 SS5]|uniref:uncharacterized protein n=1 Tax=Punctularia strigosozonata (strain HHB-11173) TaxID=741275 RepID=UPI000441812F|nr:uncharacterized protein PUNSTDRAFT_74748 [Punctularia strigosozonata HHB-11173 SS5]EIN05481.1 hypothetical protein PUNSTDRAFT_74748 [Punctularia strigosozonata HHB-11173 SS5]